jgi:hypothetical protein
LDQGPRDAAELGSERHFRMGFEWYLNDSGQKLETAVYVRIDADVTLVVIPPSPHLTCSLNVRVMTVYSLLLAVRSLA